MTYDDVSQEEEGEERYLRQKLDRKRKMKSSEISSINQGKARLNNCYHYLINRRLFKFTYSCFIYPTILELWLGN